MQHTMGASPARGCTRHPLESARMRILKDLASALRLALRRAGLAAGGGSLPLAACLAVVSLAWATHNS